MPDLSDANISSLLTGHKLVSKEDLDTAAKYAKDNSLGLRESLVSQKFITEEAIDKVVAESLKLPYINLAKAIITPECFNSIPYEQTSKYKAVVFSRDNSVLKIATCEPPINADLITHLAQKTG